MLRKLLPLILILFFSDLFSSAIDLKLKDFVIIVSDQNKVNILVDEDLSNDISFFITDKFLKSKIYLEAFERILNKKGLALVKFKDFYYIKKIKQNLEIVKIKHLQKEVIKEFFANLDNVKYTYFSNTNTIIFKANPDKSQKIKSLLKVIDVAPRQLKLKMTILETNINDVKTRQVEISNYVQSVGDKSFTYFLNLISLPLSVSNSINSNSKSGFYSAVKYLDENGYTKVESSPYFNIIDDKLIKFSAVDNIPFLKGSKSVDSANSIDSTEYDYKDVGLQIELVPDIREEYINIDLDMKIENVLSSSLTPTTSKKSLKNSFRLKDGELLVLTGINKQSILKNKYSIPFLRDIFYIGEIFKFTTNSKNNTVLTIAIEVIKDQSEYYGGL
jgi:general secretion pathway protein D